VTITGVIQAGGKSTRMGGEPKALMELGGRRVIDRVVDVLASVTDDLLVVTNTPELYASLGIPMVPDVFAGGGSLGGIYSGLKAAPGAVIFTVACDMPFLRPDVARLVIERAEEADVVIPRAGGQLETLHACYGKRCLDPMEVRIRAGGRVHECQYAGRPRARAVDRMRERGALAWTRASTASASARSWRSMRSPERWPRRSTSGSCPRSSSAASASAGPPCAAPTGRDWCA
jgi:molybdopterin-guanine dinucleotide biosynthesis protein A